MSATAPKTNNNTQSLQVVEGNFRQNQLARLDMRDLKELGDMFFASGSFSDVKSAAQAMVKIHAGHELGFSPIQSMAGIHFFQGKVAIGSTLIASLIKDSGKYDYEILEHDANKCSLQFLQLRDGKWIKMGVPVTYTLDDAKGASLTGNPAWKNHPADMLFASCVRKGSRRYTPDIFRGTVASHETYFDAEIDAVDVQAPQTANPAASDDSEVPALDAEPVGGESPEQRREEYLNRVQELCAELNKAKDSITWKAKTLAEYINDLFNVNSGLDSMTFETFDTLIADLEDRLVDLQKVPE